MPTVKLTDAAAQKLKAPKGARVDYFDATLPGFALRVAGPTDRSPEGRRTWTLFYRYGGVQKRLSLTPPYPALGLADARKQAGEALALLPGKDPAVAKQEEKNAAVAEAARERDTVGAVFALWVQRHLQAKRRAPRYIEECRRSFSLHVKPVLGDRDIRTITRRDVIELLDDIRDAKGGKGGPVQANRTLALIRALFNFAVRRGIIEASPASLVERPGAETKRERALSADDLRALWPAMVTIPYPSGPYLQLLLATGQRRSEVAGMRWADLDLNERTWTLAAEETKAGRGHLIPLSPLAVSILEGVPRIAGPYVFAGTGRRSKKRDPSGNILAGQSCPISGFAKIKAATDARVAKSGKTLEPWTIHDLRRTAATHMARLGISQFVISRVLNHADRSVTGIYNRYEYLAEKRHALDTWAQFLEGLTKPGASNVANLAEARRSA